MGDKWKKDCNTCTCTNGGLAQCTTNRWSVHKCFTENRTKNNYIFEGCLSQVKLNNHQVRLVPSAHLLCVHLVLLSSSSQPLLCQLPGNLPWSSKKRWWPHLIFSKNTLKFTFWRGEMHLPVGLHSAGSPANHCGRIPGDIIILPFLIIPGRKSVKVNFHFEWT